MQPSQINTKFNVPSEYSKVTPSPIRTLSELICPAMPTPPDTLKAPVDLEVEAVVLLTVVMPENVFCPAKACVPVVTAPAADAEAAPIDNVPEDSVRPFPLVAFMWP